MMDARRTSLAIAACLFAFLAWPGTARAELKVCNKTIDTVYFAVGYKQGDDWSSEGWWTVKSGQCKVPIGEDLKKRYYYVYASSTDDKHVVDGKYSFCAANKAFTIRGDSNCLLRGYTSLGFRKVDVGQSYSYTHMIVSKQGDRDLKFTCTCNFNAKRACGNGGIGGNRGRVHRNISARSAYGDYLSWDEKNEVWSGRRHGWTCKPQ